MWIGAGRLVLNFYNNTELKLKARQLDSLFKELKKKHGNLSILEVADEEDPERCVIGFSTVMPGSWRQVGARAFVQKICGTVDEISFARVEVTEWDVFWLGGDEGGEPRD
jgi:uncharacterized protein YlxP (DUF503 family)